MSLSNFVKRIRDIMRNDAGINGDAQRIEQMAWMLFLKVYDTKESDWEFDDDGYTSIIPDNCRWSNWAVDDKSGNAMTGDNLLNFVNNTLFPTLKSLDVNKETPIKKSIVKTTFEDANNYMKDGVLLRHPDSHEITYEWYRKANEFLPDILQTELLFSSFICHTIFCSFFNIKSTAKPLNSNPG